MLCRLKVLHDLEITMRALKMAVEQHDDEMTWMIVAV
jgi:hypothetical protein